MSTASIDFTTVSNPYLPWSKTGQIAHVLSPPSGIAQKNILVRYTDGATCRLRIECWCQNTTHSCLISGLINSWALCTRLVSHRSWIMPWIIWCLRPTPADHLPILSGIQPADLHRLEATFSLNYRHFLDPDHILYGCLSESSDACQERPRSRRPFVLVAWNLLDNLDGLGICASEWTNYKWIAVYRENSSRFSVFLSRTGFKPVEMGLSQAAWVKLNRLRTGVWGFHSSMHRWSLALSPNYECDAAEQTADHVVIACPIHRVPYGTWGLTVLDNETRCWLYSISASICSGKYSILG